MNLRLDKVGDVSVLTILDDVTARHGRVLLAGIGKLLEQRHTLIFDMTGCQVDASAWDCLYDAHLSFLEAHIPLIVAGSEPRVCQVTTRERALEMAANPARFSQDDLRVRQSLRDHVVAKKDRSAATQSAADEMAKVEAENHQLRTAVAGMERLLEADSKDLPHVVSCLEEDPDARTRISHMGEAILKTLRSRGLKIGAANG
jgi:hypothetical protein